MESRLGETGSRRWEEKSRDGMMGREKPGAVRGLGPQLVVEVEVGAEARVALTSVVWGRWTQANVVKRTGAKGYPSQALVVLKEYLHA